MVAPGLGAVPVVGPDGRVVDPGPLTELVMASEALNLVVVPELTVLDANVNPADGGALPTDREV